MSHSMFSVLHFDKYPSSVDNHDSNGKGEEEKKIKKKKKKYLINRMEERKDVWTEGKWGARNGHVFRCRFTFLAIPFVFPFFFF